MAKQRLVDFRGGINEKVSPHMIGDSQGQDAEDLDLTSVRLQGRISIDDSETALGTFYYDSSDENTSRWVSTDSNDNSYIEYSSDFAVWNRDLYVAQGAASTSGTYSPTGKNIRFLDGASEAEPLNFNPPLNTSTVTIDVPGNDANSDGWDKVLISAIAETPSSGNNFGVVSISGTNTSLSPARYYYTAFDRGYQATTNYEADAYGGRLIWQRDDGNTYVVAGSNGDGVSTSKANDLLTATGGAITPNTNTGVTVANSDAFKITASGAFDNARKFTSTGTTRIDTSLNTYYEYSGSLGGGWALNNTGSLYSVSTLVNSAFSGTVTTSNYTQLYSPTYTQNTAPADTTFKDERPLDVGTNNPTTFDLYTGSNGVTYYVPQSSSTTYSLTAGTFYTQSGGTAPGTDSHTWKWEQTVTTNIGGTSNAANANSNVFGSYVDSNTGNWKFLLRRSGSDVVRIGEDYGTTGDVHVDNASDFSTLYIHTSGFIWVLQSDGRLKSDYHTNTYLQNFHVADIIGVYGVTTSNGLRYYRSSTTLTSTSTEKFYSFQYMSLFGKVTITDSSNNVIGTVTNVHPTYSTFDEVTINNVTYTRGSSLSNKIPTFGTTTEYLQEFTTTATFPVTNTVNYTYSPHSHTQGDAYSFSGSLQATLYTVTPKTYALHTNTTDYVPGVPATPAFTYDDARTYIYEVITSAAQAWNSDNSFSTNWLSSGQSFPNTTDYGYSLRTVRDSNNLPTVSNSSTLLTPTVTETVFNTDALHTPLRLNFSIDDPTDIGTAPSAYRLVRNDNTFEVELGYIKPSSTISFTYSTSAKTISISGLTQGQTYRLRFQCYQDTVLAFGSATAVKSDFIGVEFVAGANSSHPTITLQTPTNADARFLAADFWLREQTHTGGSSSGDETFAIVKCFDLLHYVSTGTVVSGECDFLDGFSSDLSGSGVGGGAEENDAPTYLKFLKESNNFFFGVGTENTEVARYGGLADNKVGTFLFVSAYNDPTNWPLTGYVQFDSEITGIASYPGELIAFTANAVYRITGSRYDQMRKTKLATTEGLPSTNQKTIALVNRYLCWVSSSGICFYDGSSVTNLTRGRFKKLTFKTPTNIHAGQFEDTYYVVDNNEEGFAVDFSLQGFPVSRVNLQEEGLSLSNKTPVLFYVGTKNKLYSRNGIIEGDTSLNRTKWSYKTRAFDGGSFGALKLIRSVTVNGTGSGYVQIYLDDQPVFANNGKLVEVNSLSNTHNPAKVYLPAASDNVFGLPMADVWSVELTDWDGIIDWIDTDYEIITN